MNRKILQAAVAASALAYGATASAQTAQTNTNANQPPPAPGEVQVRAEAAGPKRKPPNRPMLVAGAALFGIPYITSVVVAIQSTRGSDHLMYIPVAGPWANLASRSCDTEPCHNEAISAILLTIDGVTQLAGAGLIAASFFVPEQPAKVTTTIGKAEVTFTPAKLGVGGWGLAAVGDF